jgi:plastocyanin
MKKIISLSLVSILAISMIFLACSKSSTPAMNTNNPTTVSIKNMAFSPSSLTVATGTTVTWVNNDGITHTVTADNGSFNSGNITPGNSFTHTFSAVGAVSYHCSIHPMMTGSVAAK